MKKILIPTDFSPNGADAFAYALEYIGDEDAKIHIMNVVEPIVSPADMPTVTSDFNKAAVEEALEALKSVEVMGEEFLAKSNQLILSTNVVTGQISSSIKREAEEFGADLIIMGTMGQGHNSIEKFVGTVSSAVIANAPCPVILVPKDYKFEKIDNVVFATDLDHADAFEIWRASQILLPHVTVIRCVHVAKEITSKNKGAISEFASYLETNSPSVQTMFHYEESDDVEMTVNRFADDNESQMIIMNKSRKSFWQRLFGSSHTKLMSFQIKIPLLVLNT